MKRILTPDQRAALARQHTAEFSTPVPALTKEEIREGLLASECGSAAAPLTPEERVEISREIRSGQSEPATLDSTDLIREVRDSR
jgi:hypothetical protein